jgi:phospholipid/cholesterol/gamma-HCH transport system substrate-binding protein
VKGRTGLQIRRYGRSLLVLIGLVLIGTVCGFFILLNQRLPNPFQTFFPVNAAFPSAAAVVPGLGEPVNVAGVHVGQITGVSLQGGQGVVHMEIDPSKLPGQRLFRDAHADLVPNTPLMDMQVNISPGSSNAGALPHGATIPIAQTTSPVNADELLSSLDADTRSWFTSLITELNDGTAGRGKDIQALLHTVGPTSAQLRQLGDLLAQRRGELAQYWISWFAHNADSSISTSDANGPVWRTLVLATCPGLKSFSFGPLLEALLGTTFGCT